MQVIEKECGCAPQYFIVIVPDIPTCSGEAIQCMNKIKEVMGDYRDILDKNDGKVKVTASLHSNKNHADNCYSRCVFQIV